MLSKSWGDAGDADARLGAQERKSLRKVLVEGFWRK